MSIMGAVLNCFFGLLTLSLIGVGLFRFHRVRRWGPALLKNTSGSRWIAGLFLLMGLDEAYDLFEADSIGWADLQVAGYLTVAVFWWFSRGFSVHTEGIVFGSVAMLWNELDGWGWDPKRRTLLVWSRSWPVRALSLRSVNGLDTGQANSVELEALLERLAGGVKRRL
jgi:hypothetical protein